MGADAMAGLSTGPVADPVKCACTYPRPDLYGVLQALVCRVEDMEPEEREALPLAREFHHLVLCGECGRQALPQRGEQIGTWGLVAAAYLLSRFWRLEPGGGWVYTPTPL